MALSAPLLSRLKTIEVKLEAAKGTLETTGFTALKVMDPEIVPTSPFEDRRGTGGYLGFTNTGCLGERSGKCTFTAELRGNGSGGLDPGLAILLQACAFKQATQVYNLHSAPADQKCISINVYEGAIVGGTGKKKSLAGAMGKVSFAGIVGKRMMLKFEFMGRWVAPTDATVPAYAPSTVAPLLIQGGTFTLAALAIKIGSFDLDIGSNVVMRLDPVAAGGIGYCMITDYEPILKMDPESDLVAGYDIYGAWLAGTEAAVALAVKNAADTVTFDIPKLQYRTITPGDRDGIAVEMIEGQCNVSTGEDSVKITASATA